jgi:hypothetical protein
MLVFVVPVRHPASVVHWSAVYDRLSETLASIGQQRSGEWRVVIAANTGTSLPALGPTTSVRWVELPLPVLPDPAIDKEGLFEGIRQDKGQRVLAALRDIDDQDYVMTVDYDDWISNRIAGYVADNTGGPGWVLSRGYVYGGGRVLVGHHRFNEICGSSLVIRRQHLNIVAGDETVREALVRRRLGSHRFNRQDLAAAGTPLAVLPFPGAVYRVGSSDAVTGSKDLFRYVGDARMAVRHPLRFAHNVSALRPVTPSVRTEFGLRQP